MELAESFRVKLLMAALLRTRLTKLQVRRLLGRSYYFYKNTLKELLRRGLVEEKRYSVVTIIQLTDRGRAWATKLAGDIDPTAHLEEIGAVPEYWYTLPEAAKMLNVPVSTLQNILRRHRIGYRLVEKGVFHPADRVNVKYRIWAIPASKIKLLQKILSQRGVDNAEGSSNLAGARAHGN